MASKRTHRYLGSEIAQAGASMHVKGQTEFIDDLVLPDNTLQIHIHQSEISAGKIKHCDLDNVRKVKEVAVVLDASDIPGKNNSGLLVKDGPIFAGKQILYNGQPVFAVAAPTIETARTAAQKADIKYQEKNEPLVSLKDAINVKSALVKDVSIKRGRSAPAIKNAAHQLAGAFSIGGQEHFYLEGQLSVAIPQENGRLHVYCSTQQPSQVQQLIANALKVATDTIIIESHELGGSFEGKRSQAAQWAIIAALVASKTKKPAVLSLDRFSDFVATGKSHDYVVDYCAGFDGKGIIEGIEIHVVSRCGGSVGPSNEVTENVLLHMDNCYYLKNVTLRSKNVKTDTVPSTLFRGFGAPQGILVIERIMDEIAVDLGLDPITVRTSNLYGSKTRNITHYGMKIKDNVMPQIIDEIKKSSTYQKRRKVIDNFNLNSPVIKRGIGLVPVKLGCTFNRNAADQAGAHIQISEDGLIHISHSSAETGQGVFTKIEQIVAEVLQVDPANIKTDTIRTDRFSKIPANQVSGSAQINAMAMQIAAEQIKQRLVDFAVKQYGVTKSKITFAPEGVRIARKTVQLKTLIAQAYSAGVKLSSQGFYKLPSLKFDVSTRKGRPFDYFNYGCAVCEVAIDCLSGETKILRVDILQDCGESINPSIDLGQIEGGFVQGLGWMTLEELQWNESGHLITNSPSSYKIPTCNDVPLKFNARIWKMGKNIESTLFNFRPLGESSFILAVSIYSALNHALAGAKARSERLPRLDTPVTPERILLAIYNSQG